ncbi:hypothetical protein K445DRAFT_11343 [Daldinia sp. EC12]|nr:hypothetical protein K445DRAFT_11343 [Daldinia sp. EC12]
MDKSSQAAFNGSAKSEGAGANSQPGQAQHTSPSILAYMAAVSNGNAPINTLLQLHSPEAEIAARRTKVSREVEEAMARLNQGGNHRARSAKGNPYAVVLDHNAYYPKKYRAVAQTAQTRLVQ